MSAMSTNNVRPETSHPKKQKGLQGYVENREENL